MVVLDAFPFALAGLLFILFLPALCLGTWPTLAKSTDSLAHQLLVGFSHWAVWKQSRGWKEIEGRVFTSGLPLCEVAAFLYWRPLQVPHPTATISKFGQLLHPLAPLGPEVIITHHYHWPQDTVAFLNGFPNSATLLSNALQLPSFSEPPVSC